MMGLGYLTPLGNELDSCANAISADGKVIVGYSTTACGKRAFRWKDGWMEGLGLVAGAQFRPYKSNRVIRC